MNAAKILKKEFKKKNLLSLYNSKIRSKLSLGHDGITNTLFQDKLASEIKTIKRKVFNTTYQFTVYKEKLITKGQNSYPRVVSIPTVRDQLTLKALHNILHKIYDERIQQTSAQSKIQRIKKILRKNTFNTFIKIDIQKFFSSIDHQILMDILKENIDDKDILHLITQAITQNTVATPYKSMQKNTNNLGVPQGLSISGTLASIYLQKMDEMHNKQLNYVYFRYVDDILILCNAEDRETILNKITEDFKTLKLTVHKPQKGSEKTSYGDINEAFSFLGHTFINRRTSVRKTSVLKLEHSIVKLFSRYKYTHNKKYLYEKLNLRITGGLYNESPFGWLYFFSSIDNLKLLFHLDHFVKKLFVKFSVPYDKTKIKRFSRTYYELKKKETSNYIPHYGSFSYKQKLQFLNLTKVEKKKLKKLTKEIKNKKIGILFEKEIKKEFVEIKKDIGVYY